MEQELLTSKEVATYLKVSYQTVRTWISLGKIPHSKLGKVVRFRMETINEWLKDQEIKGKSGVIINMKGE